MFGSQEAGTFATAQMMVTNPIRVINLLCAGLHACDFLFAPVETRLVLTLPTTVEILLVIVFCTSEG